MTQAAVIDTTSAVQNKTGGKPVAVQKAEHQAWLDEQTLTVSCALCPPGPERFSFIGPAGEAREAAAAHRDAEHPPETRAPARKRNRFLEQVAAARERAALARSESGQGAQEAAKTLSSSHLPPGAGPPAAAPPGSAQPEAKEEDVDYACKIKGCENRTEVRMGRYAYLCAEHRKAAGKSAGAPAVQPAAAPPPARRRSPRAANNGHVATRSEVLRELIAKQTEIDEAEQVLERKRQEFEELGERFAKAAA